MRLGGAKISSSENSRAWPDSLLTALTSPPKFCFSSRRCPLCCFPCSSSNKQTTTNPNDVTLQHGFPCLSTCVRGSWNPASTLRLPLHISMSRWVTGSPMKSNVCRKTQINSRFDSRVKWGLKQLSASKENRPNLTWRKIVDVPPNFRALARSKCNELSTSDVSTARVTLRRDVMIPSIRASKVNLLKRFCVSLLDCVRFRSLACWATCILWRFPHYEIVRILDWTRTKRGTNSQMNQTVSLLMRHVFRIKTNYAAEQKLYLLPVWYCLTDLRATNRRKLVYEKQERYTRSEKQRKPTHVRAQPNCRRAQGSGCS